MNYRRDKHPLLPLHSGGFVVEVVPTPVPTALPVCRMWLWSCMLPTPALPSGRRMRSIKSRSTRLRNIFFPEAKHSDLLTETTSLPRFSQKWRLEKCELQVW